MKRSKINWLIDAGHGGIDPSGLYTTAPAKMVVYEDGYTIHEGVVNRGIAKYLYPMLSENCIDFGLVYHDYEDTPLYKRVAIANKVYIKDNRTVYLSIHCNASANRNKPGTGFEVFTSVGPTKSDPIAEVFCDHYKAHFPDIRFREDLSDNDQDKEAHLYVLKHTLCPALLTENLFMDNRKEAEFLNSDAGQLAIAKCLAASMLKLESL